MTAQEHGAGNAAPHFEENTTNRLKRWDEGGDYINLRRGCALLRLERKAGWGAVRRAAIANHAGKSTYNEYKNVWAFIWQWRGMSARRIFDDFPELTYTHLRIARRLPFEDAIDVLMAVGEGDPAYPDLDIPMTPDTMQLYIALKSGEDIRGAVLFDEQGGAEEVLRDLRTRAQELGNQPVRVTIRELVK